MPRSLLISTRPTLVEQTLTGTKTVELRRKKPQLRPGAAVYIYATAPVKAVVARAQLAGIVSLPPARLWEEVGGVFPLLRGVQHRAWPGAFLRRKARRARDDGGAAGVRDRGAPELALPPPPSQGDR
ncbi:hypothetical protein I6I68_12860 [Corynebacterium glucuronolyticum]|uniref:hypothetical protein n=1 Tax=Corynebacterium glucuronolyticum TaxID=39791 RepID=UPI0019200F12|nr:hypothetical protein [Corynebacterium glucuronolyticum]QQU88430.1 hypothetical protein I6I68_12860 [Corynebacterium glucuronolyticum]